MAEKTNGKGSIYQLDKGENGNKPKAKCRKWKLVVSLGKDPRTGKYKQKARIFQGSYTEAQRELRKFVAEIEGGQIVKKNGWTFNDYAKHYVDTRVAAGEIQERTETHLRSTLRTLGYRIGELRLQDITPEVIETAYIDLRAGESPSGKPLSGRTLYNVNLSAFLLFNNAKEKGIISENPLKKVSVPKKENKEKRSLSAASYSHLLATLDPKDRAQCAVLLCAALGLRRSEAAGLSWGDVNFKEGSINVHASTDEHGELKDPKTEAGYRLLPLFGFLADALLKRKAKVVEELLRCAPQYTNLVYAKDNECPAGCIEVGGKFYDVVGDVPVCCDQVGERLKPGQLGHWWDNHRKKFGLEGYSLHELRHSFLSLAAAQGVHPAVMMRLAGHKDPNTTMQIYTHVNMESKREAMDAMQAAYTQAS